MYTDELISLLENYKGLGLKVHVNRYDDIHSVRLAENGSVSINAEASTDDFVFSKLDKLCKDIRNSMVSCSDSDTKNLARSVIDSLEDIISYL